jgi:hypothetical protein
MIMQTLRTFAKSQSLSLSLAEHLKREQATIDKKAIKSGATLLRATIEPYPANYVVRERRYFSLDLEQTQLRLRLDCLHWAFCRFYSESES